MKNGYYLSIKIPESESGIIKKINCHMDFFSKYYNMTRLEFSENKFRRKYLFKLPFFSAGRKYNEILECLIEPSFLYIRNVPIEKKYVKFLSDIKKQYPNCKIIVEIPTYPYDKDEYNIWYNYFVLKKDMRYRWKVKDYIDRIIVYTKDKDIFGCKTLNVGNGIDVESIEPVSNYVQEKNKITLISVGQLRPQHGFERVINGLASYYKNEVDRDVLFYIVGDGIEYNYYKSLIDRLNLQKYVFLTGFKTGKELDDLYNQADIAVASLGFYKLGVSYSSVLKNRDYLSKGLPIIGACEDDAYINNPFVLLFSNDEKEIDINKIISFYDTVYKNNKETVIKQVREIAKHNIDISNTYEPVIKFLQDR